MSAKDSSDCGILNETNQCLGVILLMDPWLVVSNSNA
jgi:hypothetical protein